MFLNGHGGIVFSKPPCPETGPFRFPGGPSGLETAPFDFPQDPCRHLHFPRSDPPTSSPPSGRPWAESSHCELVTTAARPTSAGVRRPRAPAVFLRFGWKPATSAADSRSRADPMRPGKRRCPCPANLLKFFRPAPNVRRWFPGTDGAPPATVAEFSTLRLMALRPPCWVNSRRGGTLDLRTPTADLLATELTEPRQGGTPL